MPSSQVRRGHWVAVEIRWQRNLDRPRTRPFYSFLEKDDVIAWAMLAAYALELAPLIETQYFSQIQVHECIFPLQFAASGQYQVHLRTDLALVRLIGIEQRLQFQILLFHFRAMVNQLDAVVVED